MSEQDDRLVAGRYRLSKQLGAGGMGVVWQAYDERLHRTVAVKQLRVPTSLSAPEVAEVNRRAIREGRIAAKLSHTSSITVFDVVEDDGEPYLVMEHVPSTNLSVVLQEQRTLPLDEVAEIGAQVAAALAAAHEVGVVHRDVKPGNVLLGHDDTVKITDFGISRLVEDVTGTTTDNIAGTPAYLAPEVAQGHSATFASDVFSLGATLYAAIEGHSPFGRQENAMALLHRAASGQVDPPQHAGPMSDLLMSMLAVDPEQRPTMTKVSAILTTRDWSAADVPTQVAPSLRTTRMSTPAAAAAPLPTAVQHPVAPEPPVAEDDERRKKGVLVGAVAVVVLLAVAVIVVALNQAGQDEPTAAPPATTYETVTEQPSTPEPEQPPVEEPAPTTSSRTTTSTPTSTPPPSPPPPPPADNSPEAQVSAVSAYYAAMPGGTEQNWNRLTASYQSATSKSFESYQRFWAGFSAVSVSDISSSGNNQVDATITYVRTNGSRSTERTRFGLVSENGVWKINTSSII
ncbi:serine/threonine-protein kinase [Actinokineospora pegani]|uniref:serine/threonine-protein kinase n=1 Tax=Actinokineospora pegani TaxID=2654637 RepID=UPI0012EA6996|nr:serine/threonine-protein kinase [Actinokineospora pegani]